MLLSLTGSAVFLVMFLVLAFSFLQFGAMAVSGVGGFALDITEIQGNQIEFFSDPMETAVCQANNTDRGVVRSDEQALIGLTANVDAIVIPAYSQVNLTKDIDLVPDIDGLDGFRIKIRRSNVPDEGAVSFPPQAPRSGDVSDGQVPESFLDVVEITRSLRMRVGSDDGYGDFRFERTDPVLPGDSAEITVGPVGYNDWNPVDPTGYPLTDAVRRDRHIQTVELQDLDNTNTQTDTGYTDYTDRNNTGLPEEAPGFESGAFLRRGTSEGITVTAVGSSPDFGRLDQLRGSDPDYDVPLPDPLSGDLSSQAYIDNVQFQNINDGPGEGDSGGYAGRWAQTSGQLTPGSTVSLTVDGVRRGSPPFGASSNQLDVSFGQPSGTQTSDYGIVDTTWPSRTMSSIGDQTGDLTGLDVVTAGRFATFETCIRTTSSEHKKGPGQNIPDPGVTVSRAFFDWDDDGTVDKSVTVGVLVEPSANTQTTDCFTGTVRVPNDVDPGAGTVRFLTQGAALNTEDGDPPPPSDFGPGGASGFEGEYVDRTIHIQQRSQASAFFDWNQDGVFEDEVRISDDNTTQTGTWGNTVNVDVPEDAVAGSTAMRVIHRNQNADISLLTDPDADVTTYVGETQDYTVEVAPARTDSAAYAYFDWNRSGSFDDVQYIDDAAFSSTGTTLSGSIDVPNDAKAGATIMRVVHQQDGYASGEPAGDGSAAPEPGEVVNGEWQDYTVHVESEGSFVRAWVDWENNGTWSQVADFGTTGNEGLGEGDFSNEGSFTVTDTVDVPNSVSQGVHLMRITHKQAVPATAGGGPPVPAEGTDWKGETLDVTMNTDPTIDPRRFPNVTLGSVSFKVSQLSFEEANISGDVILDDRYTDGTLQNPQFGPDGQFLLQGNNMKLRNISGRAHLVEFSFFDLPGLVIELEYVKDWNNVDDPVLGGSSVCTPIGET